MYSSTMTPIFHQISKIHYIVVDILGFIKYERKIFRDYEKSADSNSFGKIKQLHESIDTAWFHINFKFHDLREELNTLKRIYKTDTDTKEIIKIANNLDVQQTMHKISNVSSFISTTSNKINLFIKPTQVKQIHTEVKEKIKTIFPLNHNNKRLLETSINELHQKIVEILNKMYLESIL